jgi:RNA polymerase sigma factor (sigma-70 family)
MSEQEALINLDPMAKMLAKKYSHLNEFDDLYQLARIAIIEGVRTYNPKKGAKLSTYVFNLILCSLRNQVYKNNIAMCPSFYNNYSENDYVEEFYKIDFKILFDEEFKKLSDQQQQIIKLRYFDGYSVAEIAKLWNCSHQNISKLNSKALINLHNYLKLEISNF